MSLQSSVFSLQSSVFSKNATWSSKRPWGDVPTENSELRTENLRAQRASGAGCHLQRPVQQMLIAESPP